MVQDLKGKKQNNKENPNLEKSRKGKYRNLRGKLHQKNSSDGRKVLRH